MKGNLDVLKWAHTAGCPWDERTCSAAARMGHLEILQWALENGCKWVQLSDVEHNKVEIIQLAYEHRVPCSRKMRNDGKECTQFTKKYWDAWKDGNFDLSYYWRGNYIKGGEE